MKAIVLCAGLGTRLRPLTEMWPKPAVPLLGQPLLRYVLATLKAVGVTEVGINVHHLPDKMRECAKQECSRMGLGLELSTEKTLLGTGGGIREFRPFLKNERFIVFNGDILFPIDLRPVLENHQAQGPAATLVLLPKRFPDRNVEVDPSGAVRRITGYGPGGADLVPWHFSGVHIIEPKVFDFMSRTGAEDINWHVYPRLIEAGGRVQGYTHEGTYWSDVGSPETYLQAVTDMLREKVSLSLLGEHSPFTGAQRVPGGWARSTSWQGNPLRAPCFVDGATIEDGAEVGPEVYVGAGARVREGAGLRRAAVLENTVIAAGERLTGCIVAGSHQVLASSFDET